MPKFIKLTFLFLALLFTALLLIIAVPEYFVDKNAIFKLPTNTSHIVLGHSHPECAYNDSLISNFRNLAESGESYFYTYLKAKKILEHNPSIETVFIEFTNNQIIEEMNDWTWDNRHLKFRYSRYSSFLQPEDKYVLLSNNFKDYVNTNAISTRDNLVRVLKSNYNFSGNMGGYAYLVRDKTDSLLNNRKPIERLPRAKKISEVNLLYLTKTVDLCKQHGKKVFLIRSPQHKMYEGYYNEKTYQEIIKTKFSDVDYLDFSTFPLTNSEFADLDHLNHKGAKVYSEWFNELLRKSENATLPNIVKRELEDLNREKNF